MQTIYSKWIGRWEHRLATRDTNRVVRPFEWGFEWLGTSQANGRPAAELAAFSTRAVERSDEFFGYQRPSDFRLADGVLSFTSPVAGPHECNNTAYADYFPASKSRGRAVLVLPQWNSDSQSHIGLCKLLNRYGISALRMSLAYHDRRKPAETERADYHVSSNVGRTIHATRQSAIDGRACLDWLSAQGYDRLGIAGTSLGSCIALLITAHEHRLKAGVFNHVSMNFGDVVWTGISCGHIRKSLEENLSHEELVRCWSVISPSAYLHRLQGRDFPALLVWAPHDTTFLPEYSRQVLASFGRLGLRHQVVRLPCGHYTSGKMPFALWDGLAICRFLHKEL
jgi:hypothetical protein